MLLPANNEVTSNYSFPPAIVICLNASVEKHVSVLVIVHFRQVTLLSPQSINSLMFRIKLAILNETLVLPIFRLRSPRLVPPKGVVTINVPLSSLDKSLLIVTQEK